MWNQNKLYSKQILIEWNQMDYLVIMKINAFQSYLTSWSYIIKYTHNVVSNYDRLRPNAINKQRYLKYVGG